MHGDDGAAVDFTIGAFVETNDIGGYAGVVVETTDLPVYSVDAGVEVNLSDAPTACVSLRLGLRCFV